MSKYVCLSCGEIYDTDLVNFDKESDWNFCPKARCVGKVVEIDDNMIPSIFSLNQNSIYTKYCCGGHVCENSCAPYIAFDDDIMDYEEMILLRNALLIYTFGPWKEENFINYPIIGEGLFTYQNIISQTADKNLEQYLTPNKITTSLCIRGVPGYHLVSTQEAREYNTLKSQIYKDYIKLMDFASAFLQRKLGNITAEEYVSRELSIVEVNKLNEEIRQNQRKANQLETLMDKTFRNSDLLVQQNCINQVNNTLSILINNVIGYFVKERTCLEIIGWEKTMYDTYYGLTTDTKEKITEIVKKAPNCETCTLTCDDCPLNELNNEDVIKKEVKYESLEDFLKNIE